MKSKSVVCLMVLLVSAISMANIVSFDFSPEYPVNGGSGTQSSNSLQGTDSNPATEMWGDYGVDDWASPARSLTHEGITLSTPAFTGASRDRGGTNSLRQIGSSDVGPQAAMFDVLRDFMWCSPSQANEGALAMTLSGLEADTSYTLRAWFFEANNVAGGTGQREQMNILDGIGGNVLATITQNYANPDLSYAEFQMTSDMQGVINLVAQGPAGGVVEGGRLNGLEILNAPIPEPATMMLLGLGALGVLRRKA